MGVPGGQVVDRDSVSGGIGRIGPGWTIRLWLRLAPELSRFPEPERAQALREARRAPLESAELLGMVAVLAAVTALTRYTLPDPGMASRFFAALANFVIALPLLALGLAPFHRRRVRRALRARLAQRGLA